MFKSAFLKNHSSSWVEDGFDWDKKGKIRPINKLIKKQQMDRDNENVNYGDDFRDGLERMD